VSVEKDEQWQRLCVVIQRSDLLDDARLKTGDGRRKHAQEVDQAMGEYTRSRDAVSVMEELQSAGVPAGVVQNAEDLWFDPQLAARAAVAKVGHEVLGTVSVPVIPVRISGEGIRPPRSSPLLGEHEEEVICGWLGHSIEQLQEWRALGVVA